MMSVLTAGVMYIGCNHLCSKGLKLGNLILTLRDTNHNAQSKERRKTKDSQLLFNVRDTYSRK